MRKLKCCALVNYDLECWKEFDNPNGRGSTAVFPLTNNIWRRLIYDHFKRENLASVIPITNIVWFLWKYILIGADTANMDIRKRARLINTKSNFKNDRFVSFYNCWFVVFPFKISGHENWINSTKKSNKFNQSKLIIWR